MRIFFLVPDGIGVRNYLYSNIITHLNEHEIGMLHNLPQEIIDEVENLHNKKFIWQKIHTNVVETKKMKFVRELAYFARLHRNSQLKNNQAIWLNWIKLKHPKGIRKVYYNALMFLGKIVGKSIKKIEKLEKKYEQLSLQTPLALAYKLILTTSNPDIIFCTHQRSLEAGLMIAVANSLNIKTSTAIYSWDNLPKSRITFYADHYIVWSNFMHQEMVDYFPDVAKDKVEITGTPQFEFYLDESKIWSSQQFYDYFKVPQNKKLICFSGNDLSSPNDQYYLQDILEALNTLPENEQPHVMFRRAPSDFSGRFASIIEKYQHLVSIHDPNWITTNKDDFSSTFPTVHDVEILTNLCYHTQLVINIGSTMGVDYAHFNKPALYMNYHQPYNQDWYDIKFIYSLEHFRTLDGLDAVIWVNHKKEILEKISNGLSHPNDFATDRLKWKKLLTNDITNASKTIAQKLILWSKNTK